MSHSIPLHASFSYDLQLHGSAAQINASAWDALLASQAQPTPFMRHAYLAALEASGSATAHTGWTPRFFTLWQSKRLCAACALYLKAHSFGEYVFDWAWAEAHERHRLPYYPKAVVAVPFTPVPGSRLLAVDQLTRAALLQKLLHWAEASRLSSLHLLFAADDDLAAAQAAGLMLRHQVQFHWRNQHPEEARPFKDFEDFLASLTQDKRKKIRQEQRRVHEGGVSFRVLRGHEISNADWDFFYRCYERTYLEHGNPPYLARDFFALMQRYMPEAWVLFVAERNGRRIASSLIAINALPLGGKDGNCLETIAYGRYWGALERVDCLHFEACYYQPIAWCIAQGIARFEGGAQGEHKMARALMPVQAGSAHWLAHPAFARAVDDFLAREDRQVSRYLQELERRSPFRQPRQG